MQNAVIPGAGLRPDGLPDIDWVKIPAGEFIYQDAERLILSTFYISRYPITYVQFQAFLDAPDGFEQDEWWGGVTPEYQKQKMREQRFKYANHPRDSVNWYQAVAFSRWLSAKLGYKVTLPTEQQWEKAARGTDGREYPWGERCTSGYANVDEVNSGEGPHYLSQTSAVGIYPQGASPYGVMDMSGNVWEWCLIDYDNPESTGLYGKFRILRGGSWGHYIRGAHCAARLTYYDGDLDSSVFGCRVVCTVPLP